MPELAIGCSGFAYPHWRGGHGELARDAKLIRTYLNGGRDVFIYFNNDALGYAPENARELRGMFMT